MKKTRKQFILQSFEHLMLHAIGLWTLVMGLLMTYHGIWFESIRQPEKTYDVFLITFGVITVTTGVVWLYSCNQNYKEWKKGF